MNTRFRSFLALSGLICFLLPPPAVSAEQGEEVTNSPIETSSKTVGERVQREKLASQSLSVPEREARPLINGCFGMGKNFHAFRAGGAFSPWTLPQGWERWDLYVEAAFYVLHRRIYNPRKLYIPTLSAFTRYHLDPWSMYEPYWDLGLGVAWRDKKEFGNIPLSTHFSFHVLTALGLYPFGTDYPSISVRWYHFSNAKIKTPNNGIDIHFCVALEQRL